jgi:Ca-activated chloride channel family protein
MLSSRRIFTAVSARARALAWVGICGAVFCVPSFAQDQTSPSQSPTQSAVPHPPAAPAQPSSDVPHPPESQKRSSTDSNDQPDATFRVNVKLVNVFATVTDSGGAPVSALKQDDFRIFEDGEPQQIAVFHRESELPLSIVVAIDTSLSTHGNQKLELESARRFAHAILRPIDGLSLFQFSEIVDQLTPFTSDVRVIDKAINRVHSGAATALYDTLYLGSDALLERRGRKVMVVITDGGDTVSKTSYQEAIREAQQAEVILYSIIIVPIENSAGRDIGGEHALIQLSRDTGGKYFYASGMEQLDAAFRQISDELRTQYLIAYYPSRRISDSDFRRIDIKIDPATKDYPAPAELSVRHRTGYYTMPSK